MEFWLSKHGYDEGQLTEQQRKHLTAAWRVENPPRPPALPESLQGLSPAELGARSLNSNTYQNHMTTVEDLAAFYVGRWEAMQNPLVGPNPSTTEKIAKFRAAGERAQAEGWDMHKAHREFSAIDRYLPFSVQCDRPRLDGSDADVLTASLMISTGISERDTGKLFGEQVMHRAVEGSMRGMTLHGLMRHVLLANGQRPPAGKFTTGDLRRVFDIERGGMHAGDLGASTISLSGVLSNFANKSSLASYQAVPVTWPAFCKITDLSDFKLARQYRMTGSGVYEQVAPGGELKHASLQEMEHTIQLDTYGKLIALDRRDLINDDLGKLQDAPKILGRMASLKLERSVYELLLANSGSPAFFSETNKNLIASELILGDAGLAAAYQLFRQQLDQNGEPVMIEPKVLLCSPANEMAARALVRASTVVIGAEDTIESTTAWSGMFDVIASPWLAASLALHANASDARWWLLAAGGDYAPIQVAFLNGQQTPTFETADLDFDRLGLAMRSFHDFGVGYLETAGAVMSSGSPES